MTWRYGLPQHATLIKRIGTHLCAGWRNVSYLPRRGVIGCPWPPRQEGDLILYEGDPLGMHPCCERSVPDLKAGREPAGWQVGIEPYAPHFRTMSGARFIGADPAEQIFVDRLIL